MKGMKAAVAELTERATIERPPVVVWSVLAAFGAISDWAPNVDHSCLTTAQPGDVGAERRVQVGRTALLERVVAWDPAERLSYQIVGLPPVVRSVTNSWTLAPAGEHTVVSITTDVDVGPRPPQQVVARLIARQMAKASTEMLAGLTDFLEQDRR